MTADPTQPHPTILHHALRFSAGALLVLTLAAILLVLAAPLGAPDASAGTADAIAVTDR